MSDLTAVPDHPAHRLPWPFALSKHPRPQYPALFIQVRGPWGEEQHQHRQDSASEEATPLTCPTPATLPYSLQFAAASDLRSAKSFCDLVERDKEAHFLASWEPDRCETLCKDVFELPALFCFIHRHDGRQVSCKALSR